MSEPSGADLLTLMVLYTFAILLLLVIDCNMSSHLRYFDTDTSPADKQLKSFWPNVCVCTLSAPETWTSNSLSGKGCDRIAEVFHFLCCGLLFMLCEDYEA